MWSAPADSKLCFRLTKTIRFNGLNATKPSPPQSSRDHFFLHSDILHRLLSLNIKKNAGTSFLKLPESHINHFKVLGRHKTANNYLYALKHSRQFRQEKDIKLEELPSNLMKNLIEKGLKMNTT